MFEHDDCKESQDGLVEIEGCSSDALKTFLDLLILGRPSKGTLSEATLALDTFVLADKYNVPCLRAHLAPIVAKKVNRENCLKVLVTAYLHDNDDMMDAGLAVLRDSKEQLTSGEEWKHMVAEYPKLINTLLMRIL